MSDVKIKIKPEGTTIIGLNDAFKMSVSKNAKPSKGENTALLEATLYQEQGSFVPSSSYLFEALDDQENPLPTVDLVQFRNAVDFFFNSILDTEYYVKSIPKESSLCSPELRSFKFE